MKTLLLAMAAFAGACGEGVFAQSNNSDLPRVVNTASPSASIGGSGAQVVAGSDDSSVALKFSYELSGVPQSIEPGIVRNGATFTTLSLTASAPLGKGEQRQTLFGSGGIGKANTIGISAYYFFADWRNPSNAEKKEYDELCAAMRKTAEKSFGVKPEDAAKLECRKTNFAKYAVADLSRVQMLRARPMPGGWGAAINGKIGQSDATYYDSDTLAKSTARNKPWSLGLVVSYVPPSGTSLVSLGWDRRKSYKDQDPTTRCPTGATTPSVECVAGSFGVPSKQSSSVVTIEGRILLPRDMALSVAVARDISKKITAVEVPLYLAENAAGGLTGGLKLNWDTDKKKTTLGVFVGVPFAVWK